MDESQNDYDEWEEVDEYGMYVHVHVHIHIKMYWIVYLNVQFLYINCATLKLLNRNILE